MADKLRSYRAKRDFHTSPEPTGDAGEAPAPAPRFVIQEHHARSLHWDLRLERDGVLASWALPRGVPPDPKQNHLAVHTEDHPLEYIDFHGEIPAGQYGAGTMKIWDRGEYECHKFRDDEVIVTLRGERVEGKYVLFQTKGKNWMIHRMDPPADPGREPMPEHVEPMLSRAAPLPPDESRWGFEVKWDGVRAIAYAQGGRVRFEGRRGNDISSRYPELRELGRSLGSREAVLDGEIVALDEGGRPDFGRLQNRMHVGSESAARRRVRDLPVTYVAFDLLYLEGRVTMALPYEERRRLLDELGLAGPYWRTPSYHAGDGKALLAATREQGLEGVIAKRLDSPYEPGRRSGAWLKVKNQRRQSFVVGGFTAGEGARSRTFGALLVGYWDRTQTEAEDAGEPQRLIYAGNVGTGFKEADLRRLGDALAPLRRDSSPFDAGSPPKRSSFVEPRLVVDVEFGEWTRAGILRAPSYKGLRDDEDPRDVVREVVI